MAANVGEDSFGNLTISAMMPTAVVWPDAVTFDGETEVTLTLQQTAGGACVIVDDFVLVDADVVDGELVKNGSFETGDTWQLTNGGKSGDVTLVSYTGDWGTIQHFCRDVIDGGRICRLKNNGLLTQPVTVPEDGIYRLRYWTASRFGDSWFGHNPVRVWVEADGARTVLDETEVHSFGFVEHSRLVRLSAGTYTFGIEGMNDTETNVSNDRISLIDKVSLTRYVEADFAATPDTSEDLDIVVASGAKLRLDFAGTNQVRTVVYNGHRKSGLISAETHPEFVEGPGVLATKKFGFTIIVR